MTAQGHEQAVRDTVAALAGSGPTRVFVGGGAVAGAETAAELGADGWTGTDARSAVAAVEALLGP
jgi:methylmalonyl-CoA mutase cobalamin-binding subunit